MNIEWGTTSELRWEKRYKRVPISGVFAGMLRQPYQVLQQKWVQLTDELPKYEWRDVEVVDKRDSG